VGLPYFFRRWLGRAGALVASTLILLSPSLMYYSRYIRHDPYMVVWTVLLALALFKYVQERQTRWLIYGAAVLSLAVTTMENSFIVGFIGLTFVAIAALWERASERLRSTLQLALLAAATALVVGVVVLHVAITPNAIRAHINFLASDALEGREAGTRGYDVAAAYVAAQFEAVGAEPAGDDGTYFQQVRLRTFRIDPGLSRVSGSDPT
ncbi:MAG: glycosyltransferase family 39 protein, partial [Thermoanaerobaculia bacterium]